MFSSLVHLVPSLSNFIPIFNISYPNLIKFHDFVDNSQERMKHQMRGPTQAQEGMTFTDNSITSWQKILVQVQGFGGVEGGISAVWIPTTWACG
jgi:hypothetical protein